MKEDNILIGQIEDKMQKCRDDYMVTHTGFLDAHRQSIARSVCRGSEAKNGGLRTVFYGGFDEAERVILVCLPDYADVETADLLTVIRVEKQSSDRQLTHRDYLGSLLALGIKREMTGDILVRPDGADIIVLSEMAEFLLTNYEKAGRTALELSAHSINELLIPDREVTTVTDTVASLRLDNVAAACFDMPRSKAAAAIAGGLVFVNHIEEERVDTRVSTGDKIVLRGRGRVRLTEVGGKSRKGRQYITFEREK